MKKTNCPYCNNTTYVDDRDWGLTIQCEGPRCEKFFTTAHLAEVERLARHFALPDLSAALAGTDHSTGPRPSAPEEPPIPRIPGKTSRYGFGYPFPSPSHPAPSATPRLTGPHRCQVCLGELRNGDAPIAFGESRLTLLHTLERGRSLVLLDNCRTDIYAAIYHCPGCLTLLETPSYQWGQSVSCPVTSCGAQFTAPFDNVLHRRKGDAREGLTFEFPCPACGHLLLCDTMREGQPTAGLPVVCVHEPHLILVPGSGLQVGETAAAVGAVEAVQQVPDRRCPECGQMVPANSSPCPNCGPVA